MKLMVFRNNQKNIANWLKKYYISVLIASAVLAMTLSLIIGLNQSIWFDEAYSIMLAKQPIAQIIHLTALDTHPPLYYLLLSLWGNVFGWSELAMHSMSVLAMGGAIVVAGLFIRKIFGTKAAVFVLPFMVFAPMMLRYGFEVRMYSLATLIGISATYVLVAALNSDVRNKKRTFMLYFCYALLVTVGMMTLYYLALLWLAHFTWLVMNSRANKEQILKTNWFKAYIGSVVLFLPWLPYFISQISNGALAPISQSMTLDNLIGIVSFSFIYRPNWQVGALLSIIIVLVIVCLVYLSVNAYKLVDKKQNKYLNLLAIYIMVPIIILTLAGLLRPMYVERYIAHVLIGASLFIGVASSMISKKSSRLIKAVPFFLSIVMLIGVVQLSLVGNYNFQRLQKPQVEQVANIVRICDSNNLVLAADPYVAIELSYYLTDCQINFYSDTASLGGGYSNLSNSKLRVANPRIELASAKSIYYVYYSNSKLTMPDDMMMVDSQNFGQLIIERFIAR